MMTLGVVVLRYSTCFHLVLPHIRTSGTEDTILKRLKKSLTDSQESSNRKRENSDEDEEEGAVIPGKDNTGEGVSENTGVIAEESLWSTFFPIEFQIKLGPNRDPRVQKYTQ
ncbi:hypothetical protein YC2023_060372 [Brassica napus]